MNLNRRAFLYHAGSFVGARTFGQGMATRNIKRQARAAGSKTPFAVQFTDVARQAGLNQPVIYGGIERKDYILEANRCGCAFIDFDNDRWMDIFLFTGTRLEGSPAGTTNRLYGNNRDGTFTEVTEKAGLRNAVWANAVCVGDCNNDGFEDLFCTYFGHNKLYRNNGDGTFTDVPNSLGFLTLRPVGIPVAASSTTTGMAIWTYSYRTTCSSTLRMCLSPVRTSPATGKV